MASYGGAGTGRLLAAQFLQKQKNDERDYKLREMQAYDQSMLNEQALKNQELNYKRQQFEMQRAEEERKSAKREAALLSTSQSANAKTREGETAISASQALVSTYRNLGRDLASTNPKRAQEFLDKALEIENKIPEVEKRQFDAIQAKRQERTDMLADVTDQASWDVARAASASMGLAIPATYKDFNNPATKEWISNQNVFSKAGKIAMDATYKAQQAQLAQQQAEVDKANKESQIRVREANEARKQSGMDTIPKETKLDKVAVRDEKNYLAETSEKFDSLSSKVQSAVVRDVANISQDLLRTRKASSLDEARQMARQQVLDRISEDGTYNPGGTSAKPTSQFVNGKVYQDANGNRAKYNNGKWEPIK